MSGWKASVLHSSKPGRRRRRRRRRRLQARSITPALLPVVGQLTPTAHRPSVYHVRAKPKSSPTTKNVTELEPGNVMTTPTRDGNKFSSLNPRLPSSHTFISRYSLVDICAVERRRTLYIGLYSVRRFLPMSYARRYYVKTNKTFIASTER